MRVNPADKNPIIGAPNIVTSEKSRGDFDTMLIRSQKIQEHELSYFLTQLEEQGKKLSESMSSKDLIKFKNMIKSFLQSTFGQSRQMQEESMWDFRGQPRIMARVSKVNQALEELGEHVLSRQAEPMEILNKIGEIKGLIIDLFG
ncbi:MAG: YaaR family protein [Peptococcaceae bacterium]|nr:YaaR family protein [Peptococcaceae bacterium]